MTRYVSRGPVEDAATALLPETVSVRCAPKSPLGPRALRVDGAVDVEWLRAQLWVDAVQPRPFGAYVAVTTGALLDWVVAAFAPGAAPWSGTEGAGRTVSIAHHDTASPARLDDLRAEATADAVGRLLGSRGFAIGPDGEAETVATGSVDVPNGPLRARHGGFVYAADLAEEVGRRLRVDDSIAIGLLRYTLLRHERSSSVMVDERAVYGPTADAYLLLVRARGAEDAPVRDSRGLRALLVQLDLMPSVVSRAASDREPAYLVRYLDTLAERLRATPQRPVRLQDAIEVVVPAALRLAAIDAVAALSCP